MTSRCGYWFFGTIVVSTIALLAAAPVRAAEDSKVGLKVWTIRATRGNDEISPKLKPLAETLKKTFKFTGYKLLKEDEQTVEVGKILSSSLAGGYKAAITPLERALDKIKLQIVVTRREGDKEVKKLNTMITLAEERFQLFGGWKLDTDDVLIVAVAGK